MKVKPI